MARERKRATFGTSDEILRVGLGAISGFAEHAALSKKLNGNQLPEQERRAGWPG